MSSNYTSVFNGKEFYELQKGLDDDSIDILCRYCENASPLDEYNLPEKKDLGSKVKKVINKLVHRMAMLWMSPFLKFFYVLYSYLLPRLYNHTNH